MEPKVKSHELMMKELKDRYEMNDEEWSELTEEGLPFYIDVIQM